MADPAATRDARMVLAGYKIGADAVLVPHAVGDRLSGAVIWQVRGARGAFCLKAWPATRMPQGRLALVHRLMRQARGAGLDFVPAVVGCPDGIRSSVVHAGYLWDLSTWMPGASKPVGCRLPADVAHAVRALAQLHGVWAGRKVVRGPCPAVTRRLKLTQFWLQRLSEDWQPRQGSDSLAAQTGSWRQRAWEQLRRRLPKVPALIRPWHDRPVALQPCMGDPRAEHFLFQGQQVTGLVDFGAAGTDWVGTDAARLLGSFADDYTALWNAGLAAYQETRPLTPEEVSLVRLLDRTGTLLTLAKWLGWLEGEGPSQAWGAAAAQRLQQLLVRVEQWPDQTL